MNPNVHGRAIYKRQGMEATEVSTNRWMDKDDVAQIHNGVLLRHKKEEN